jgi:cytochrome b involved in lipid metabolism
MSLKSTAIFLVTAFALVGGITLIANYSAPTYANTPVAVNTNSSYTLADVAIHSSTKSCWTIVRTQVYDLTSWINSHPGGPETILSMCGKDATANFEDQHGGQQKPEEELKNYQIGTYKQ